MDNALKLTLKQRRLVQYIAVTSNALLHRNKIGVSQNKIKEVLNISDQELKQNILIINDVLKTETVPAKIIFDDTLNQYVYLQKADTLVVLERLNIRSLLLLMLLFYNQRVINKPFTTLEEMKEIIDATVAEKNTAKIKTSLEPLLHFSLIYEKKEETYIVTKIGEEFMDPLLLKKLSDVTLSKSFSLEAVIEFFRKSLNPIHQKEADGLQNELFKEDL